jgi:hypothetical protein
MPWVVGSTAAEGWGTERGAGGAEALQAARESRPTGLGGLRGADRCQARSLKVLGCGLATTGVIPE